MKSGLYFTVFFAVLFQLKSNAQLAWVDQDHPGSGTSIKDVFFYNENLGWAVGVSGLILHTNNGGDVWVQQFSGTGGNFHGVWFTSELSGWVVGDNGALLKTDNAGANWIVEAPPLSSSTNFYDVWFTDASHGWICGASGNFRTLNGGGSWIAFDAQASGTDFYPNFLNNNEGWVAGVLGYVGFTTDGGASWTPVVTSFSGEITGFFAHSMSKLTVVTDAGAVYQSQDSGNSWYETMNAGTALFDVHFAPDGVGVSVGQGGVCFVSFDAGESWISNSQFTSNALYSVFMLTDGVGWAVGDSPYIHKSQHAPNDLIVEAYQGLDYVCPNTPVNVIVTFYNQGPGIIEEADFVILEGATPVLYHHWTGFIHPQSYIDINLGIVVVENEGIYQCVISGDSITNNNTSNKFISVYDVFAAVSEPVTICAGDSVEINASGGIGYQWLNAGNDSANPFQWVSPDVSTDYFVMIETNDCEVIDSVQVFVNSCTEPVSAFSPNNDGINDFLQIENSDEKENIVRIYNRWGDLVKSFTNYNNASTVWDGTDQFGNNVIEGTYYYIFETTDHSVSVSSWVQLVR